MMVAKAIWYDEEHAVSCVETGMCWNPILKLFDPAQ
jgi:hypothetical protein